MEVTKWLKSSATHQERAWSSPICYTPEAMKTAQKMSGWNIIIPDNVYMQRATAEKP
jgi:hypothetical protein